MGRFTSTSRHVSGTVRKENSDVMFHDRERTQHCDARQEFRTQLRSLKDVIRTNKNNHAAWARQCYGTEVPGVTPRLLEFCARVVSLRARAEFRKDPKAVLKALGWPEKTASEWPGARAAKAPTCGEARAAAAESAMAEAEVKPSAMAHLDRSRSISSKAARKGG